MSHGGTDPGAVYGTLQEKEINLDVVFHAAYFLKQCGYQVAMTRTFDCFVSLEARARIANVAIADCFLSVHTNAVGSGSAGLVATGEEIYHFPNSTRGKAMAQSLQKTVDYFFPDEPFRGIKEANFEVLRETMMPAVLIEIGFIHQSRTDRRLDDPKTRYEIGLLLAVGVVKYFGDQQMATPI